MNKTTYQLIDELAAAMDELRKRDKPKTKTARLTFELTYTTGSSNATYRHVHDWQSRRGSV